MQTRLMGLFLTVAATALPLATPVAPVVKTVVTVTPAIRQIVRKLHQVDVPLEWRRRNWTGNQGEGSCVHASMVHLFHLQGRHKMADWWAQRFANGETSEGLAAKLEAAGVEFAETRDADLSFLEWCMRTRRGAAVVVQNGKHMVNLVGLDKESAFILDSNSPERVQRWSRDEFLADWINSGGWAVTPVGTPPAPKPWVIQ